MRSSSSAAAILIAWLAAFAPLLATSAGCASRGGARPRPPATRETPPVPSKGRAEATKAARAEAAEPPRTEEILLPGQSRVMPSQDRRDGSAPPESASTYGAEAAHPAHAEAPPAPVTAPSASTPLPAAASAREEPARVDPPAPAPRETRYRVQVLAVARAAAAGPARERLGSSLGVPTFLEEDAGFWKLRVGNFTNREEAESMVRRLRKLGYSDAFLVVVKGR